MFGALKERGRLTVCTAVLAAVAAMTAGCGSDQSTAQNTPAPDRAATACRAKWGDLAQRIEGNEQQSEPSALADRWNSVVATVDYYTTSARGRDCGDPLRNQQKAIVQLQTFSRSLRPWDMEYQLSTVEARAGAYATTKPSPKPKGKGGQAKGKNPPPSPKEVDKALATLRKQAPNASQDQLPGWQQANAIDLQNKAAVKKAHDDLDFLSHHSKAWNECADALRVIRKALRS